MKINKVILIYFSPTRTTKQIVEEIAKGMGPDSTEPIDLTLPMPTTSDFGDRTDSIAIVGVPVYGGRVPALAVKRLQGLKANGMPAIPVVVYGNRAFEDALVELKDLLQQNGFLTVAAGAFIGEHSFSRKNLPIAKDRPDDKDFKTAFSFGKEVQLKLSDIDEAGTLPTIAVPGDVPYKKWDPPSGAPRTREEACTLCATCVDLCPAGAITVDDAVVTDPSKCILCCACIKGCPGQAKWIDVERINQISQWLHENCADRKEPEVFLQ
ncbi:(Fe-S)-binding protein [Desulfosarcina widdelii]|uniref:(Fe-S)-binding protein n=1 Tax=Desulfosarcina widdelii TaxID=947919 RepID=A0A5K7ZCJ0_9BACT|nr:4Fe-4S binding protein [Desulfosarcina widdelii]BBO78495.1 (Fe-S)-binding protein [Desulfosarcina widdelii]